MSKWTMLAVSALSVSAGIFFLCSVSSLIRDFEDAFSYEDQIEKGTLECPFLFLGIRRLFRKDLVVSCTCLNTVHIGDDGLHSCRTYRVVGGQVYEGHEEFTIGLNREGFLLRAWRE